tara:strand:+ start:442 stop:738 length:297 start_codon:yes stop_codon:yes gene_type:complete
MKRKLNAVYIELVPKTEGTFWNGEVELNIICDPNSTLDKESQTALNHLAQLVACAVPIMEVEPNVAMKMENFLSAFVKKKFDIKSQKDNVIHIDFKKE